MSSPLKKNFALGDEVFTLPSQVLKMDGSMIWCHETIF
jgi:hypothetical protein